jgi:hypothetical protein
MNFKIETNIIITFSHCRHGRGFLFYKNAIQCMEKYSKPLAHIVESDLFF